MESGLTKFRRQMPTLINLNVTVVISSPFSIWRSATMLENSLSVQLLFLVKFKGQNTDVCVYVCIANLISRFQKLTILYAKNLVAIFAKIGNWQSKVLSLYFAILHSFVKMYYFEGLWEGHNLHALFMGLFALFGVLESCYFKITMEIS